jgi:chaperone modulatory protein CbpM
MPAKNSPAETGQILEETAEITLAELTRTCRVHAEWVMELVEEGVLEPLGPGGPQCRFSATSVVRVRKAQRLQRDLGVNLPGIALALELLDRIEKLEARLRTAAVPPPPGDDADTE